MIDDPASIYTRAYYADAYEATLVAARLALPAIFEAPVWPQYLVDVGCGSGAWCDAAVALGEPDVTGIDGWWARREHPTPWRFMATLSGFSVPDVSTIWTSRVRRWSLLRDDKALSTRTAKIRVVRDLRTEARADDGHVLVHQRRGAKHARFARKHFTA